MTNNTEPIDQIAVLKAEIEALKQDPARLEIFALRARIKELEREKAALGETIAPFLKRDFRRAVERALMVGLCRRAAVRRIHKRVSKCVWCGLPRDHSPTNQCTGIEGLA